MTDRSFLNDVALFGQIWIESECNYTKMSRVTGVPRTTISDAAKRIRESSFSYRMNDFPSEDSGDGAKSESRKETVAFINDTHSWHVDSVIWTQVLAWLEYLKPDRLVHLGDAVDNPSVSRFSPRSITVPSLNQERESVREQLVQLRDAIGPEAKFDLTPGNHEDRIWRWLMDKAPQAADMPEWTIANWLGADQVGLTVHGLDGFSLVEDFRCYHGTHINKSNGMSTAARAELIKWNCSGISGHTHYTDHACRVIGGSLREWWSNGCLTSTESEYVIGPSNWHQAVSVGYFDHDNPHLFQIEQIKIRDQKLIWRDIDFSQ